MAAEKTWDCPCHGGRYAGTGDVLNGPPVSGLAEAALEEEAPVGTPGQEPA